MAVCLRRGISSTITHQLSIRCCYRINECQASSVQCRSFSKTTYSSIWGICQLHGTISQPSMVEFLKQHRRGFAKGRKSNDSSVGNMEVDPNFAISIKATMVSLMEAAIVSLSRELGKLRTGRASSGMLDHIIVESGGVKSPLSRLAVVSVIDPKTLSINPYDPSTIKALESAIISSPLGLNPRVDGERLIASIPPLTKEHVQAINKVVAKSCEDVRQSIRRARQKSLDGIKKASSTMPKDDVKKLEKEIDDSTKKFVKTAEDMCKAKEKEIGGG